jgi:hypothetical protein
MLNDRYTKLRVSDFNKKKYKRGTVEHLWNKWYNKLWNSYGKFALKPPFEPPSAMRNEFIRDVHYIMEIKLSQIAPERTTLKNN